MLQGSWTWSQAKYNMYTLEERVKDKRYGAKNGPTKTARHFSQLLDGKLPWGLGRSGYIIFGLRDQIAKF